WTPGAAATTAAAPKRHTSGGSSATSSSTPSGTPRICTTDKNLIVRRIQNGKRAKSGRSDGHVVMLRVSRQLRQSVPRFVLEFARRDVAAIYVLFGGAPPYLASLSHNGTVAVVSSTDAPLTGISYLLDRTVTP